MQPHLNNSKKLMLNKIIWVTQTQPTCVIRKKKPCQLTKNRVVFDWGVITFERPYESDWGTLEGHFLAPRVAALFADLAPQDGGSSLEQWQSAFFSGGVGMIDFVFFCGGGGMTHHFLGIFVFFFFMCFFFHQGFLWVLWEISGILLPITIAAEDSCCASRGCNL